MVGEALNQCVDITIKRKQLLQSLTEAKIPPQIDEKVRKSIKEVLFFFIDLVFSARIFLFDYFEDIRVLIILFEYSRSKSSCLKINYS